MKTIIAILLIILWSTLCPAQQVIVETISAGIGNEIGDLLWLQIPANYNPSVPTPLLFGWHEYGADAYEFSSVTTFDEECNSRGWLCASINGVSLTNWTNPVAQSSAVSALNYIDQHYNLDHSRIYMIGASMGGGGGLVFSNNHLDPGGFMIAATVSVSGIMDDIRRFNEQGYNYSMVAAFGGPPWEVPFEYQRNSPAYFKCDSSSMHWNLCHLPVNLTVGQDDYPWVYHAQDMYQLLEPIADTVYYEQTSVSGHGWEVISERQACEWLMNFSLNSNPAEIMINADEPDVYYWTEVLEQIEGGNFTRYDANYDTSENSFVLTVYFNLAGLAMNLNYMNLNSAEDLSFELDGQQAQNMELRLRDYQSAPVAVLRDGVNYHWWYYNSSSGEVVLTVGGNHQFEILMNAGADKNLSKTSGISVSHYAEGQNEVLILNINDLLSGEIEVKIFDLLGRERWDQYYQFASSNQIELHNFNLPSGIYFIQAKVGNQIFNHKLLIIK